MRAEKLLLQSLEPPFHIEPIADLKGERETDDNKQKDEPKDLPEPHGSSLSPGA